MKDNGGPAFPQIEGKWHNLDYSEGKHLHKGGEYEASGGMSLRDWFAGMALQGLLANLSTEFACKNLTKEMEYRGDPERRSEWTVSRAAYHYADAMLKMREEGE